MITAAECKEKWRNIRTVYIRKVRNNRKPLPNGYARRRTKYYLEDDMEFCLPFIKPLNPDATPIKKMKTEFEEETVAFELSPYLSSPEPSSESESSESHGHGHGTMLPSSSNHVSKRLSSRPAGTAPKRKLRNSSPADEEEDEYAAEHYNSKELRIDPMSTMVNIDATNSHNAERKEALRMFLLSLIPEVEEFTDFQINLFKRRIFGLIDEISS